MYAAPIKNMSVLIASGLISEDSVQRVGMACFHIDAMIQIIVPVTLIYVCSSD